MLLDDVRKLTPLQRLRYWIVERESVRLKKEAGEPKPWTDDEILRTYRFCNVRRMDDKVSRWLLENWYRPYFDHPNMLVAVAIARFFNLPSTLKAIQRWIFQDGWAPAWGSMKKELRAMKVGGVIFNAAYMVRGNDGEDKIESVVEHNVKPLVDNPPTTDRTSMEKTWAALLPYHGWGSFMAGQVVADLRWAMKGTWEDRDVWAPRGPGSTKGMNRLYERPTNFPLTQSQFLEELLILMDDLSGILPTSITSRLEAHDYQNCLCEFTGYEKVLWGEGRKKQLYGGV